MDSFYRDLAAIDSFEDVADFRHYTEVPDSWFVVITDVRGSTKAIEAGRYKEVNVLGASSIVAALNAVDRVSIPYVFGGDGATLLLPPSVKDKVVEALVGLSRRAEAAYGLGLRVGLVPIKDLHEEGHSVRIAKYAASDGVQLAMFSGGGLGIADNWIKDEERGKKYAQVPNDSTPEPNLDGLQCRWNPIQSRNGNMLSILVVALAEDEGEKAKTYQRVLAELESIAKSADISPVDASITLADNVDAFDAEAKIVTGKPSGAKMNLHKAKAVAQSKLGSELMKAGKKAAGFDGATYKDQVVANTDFRKFDDCLRMVLDTPPDVEEQLRAQLEAEHQAGHVAYGIHASSSALMTCLVFEYDQNHVHFVDGGDGGYALAAKGLKVQLKSAESAE